MFILPAMVTVRAGTESRPDRMRLLPTPLLAIFLAGAESLESGRRVKGREATACDTAGALEAAAVTAILVR